MTTESLDVKTALARAGYDRVYFRGLELSTDLIDDSVWSVLSLALGNRRLTDEEARVMNALAIVAAVGDPRIWPLKVTRLVGSYGHPFAAVAAGTSFLDEIPLGPWALYLTSEFLTGVTPPDESEEKWLERAIARSEEIARSGRPVPGFGVAGRERDERYVDFVQWYTERPETHGPHWKLFRALADHLRENFGLEPNIAGPFASVGLDFGLGPLQIAFFMGSSAHWATQANAFEALRESPEVLRKLPDEFVEYVGPAPRKSPRAVAAESDDE